MPPRIPNHLSFNEWVKYHKDKFVVLENGCWEWCGGTNGNGYSRVSFGQDNKMFPAHRIFYEKKYGVLAQDLEPHHTCRNYRCVNPDHIEPLTHIENCQRDFHKLVGQEDEIRALRNAGKSLSAIGRIYGVDKSTIKRIVNASRRDGTSQGGCMTEIFLLTLMLRALQIMWWFQRIMRLVEGK